MIQIRKNTFETNSSSTHTLIICDKSDYDLLENKDAIIWDQSRVISEKDNIKDFMSSHDLEYWKEYCEEYDLNPDDIKVFLEEAKKYGESYRGEAEDLESELESDDYEEDSEEAKEMQRKVDFPFDGYEVSTLDGFFESEYLEEFTQRFTTKNGDEIVAFGLFGQEY